MDKEKRIVEIYNEYFLDVYRFSMYKLGKKEEAEDVTSEVFTRLINYKKFDEIENHKAWLITVSRNLIYDKFRKKMKPTSLQVDDGEYIEIEDSSTHFEDDIIDEQLTSIVKTKLSELDEETSEIITLKVWQEMTFGEIAELMKLNENTAKQKYYRGIEKIKNDISLEEKQLEALSDNKVAAAVNQVKFDNSFRPDNSFRNRLFDQLFSSKGEEKINQPKSSMLLLDVNGPKLMLIMYTVILFSIAGVYGLTQFVNNQELIGLPYETETDTLPEPTSESKSVINAEECGFMTYESEKYPEISFKYDSCLWDLEEKTLTEGLDQIRLAYTERSTRNNIQLEMYQAEESESNTTCYDTEYEIINEDLALGVSRAFDTVWNINEGVMLFTEEYSEFNIDNVANPNVCYLTNTLSTIGQNGKEYIVNFSGSIEFSNLEVLKDIVESIILSEDLVEYTTTNFENNFSFTYPEEFEIYEGTSQEYSEDRSDSFDIPTLTLIYGDFRVTFIETSDPLNSFAAAGSGIIEEQDQFDTIEVNGETIEFFANYYGEGTPNQEDEACLYSYLNETYFAEVIENIYVLIPFEASSDCSITEVETKLEKLHNDIRVNRILNIIRSVQNGG